MKQKYIRGLPILSRFMRKVSKKKNSCWQWTAYKTKDGYGVFRLKNSTVLAHRFSYQLFKKKVSSSILVCHHCDNPSCVNPDHLFLGLNKDNSNDKVRKKRHSFGTKVHCSKLDLKKVKKIRIEYNKGKISQRALAAKYKVAHSGISNIVNYKTWGQIG